MKENDIYEKITYKQGIPYYMGMPCFLDGKKLNSKPKIDKVNLNWIDLNPYENSLKV